MKKTHLIPLFLLLILSMTMFTGCVRPYQQPIYEEVQPNEIAILVPLEGDSSQQGSLSSEEFLKKNLVQAKRVEIPTRWKQTGRRSYVGEYIPTHKLIKLSMAPVTREWTASSGTGTSGINQGFEAESIESIGFITSLTATASITSQANAIVFLSKYAGQGIDVIMDTEVRNRIATILIEQYSKLTIEEIRVQKAAVMELLRKDIIPYFESRGLTISTLGYKEAITYTSDEIQKSIDAKFVAEKGQQAQSILNQTTKEKAASDAEIAEAKAVSDAKIVEAQAATLDKQIQLLEAQAKLKAAEAEIEKAKNWRPTVIGAGSVMVGQ